MVLAALALHAVPAASEIGEAPDGPVGSGDPELQGEVRDRVTNEPVESALVTLTPSPGVRADVVRVVTRADGTFEVTSVPEGEYRVEVQHVAYGDVDETITIAGDEVVRMEISVVTEPLRLEPLVAVASRWIHPSLRGFHERMETGIGQYLDREDIEAAHPHRATDLFRRISGVRVRPAGHYLLRDQLVMSGGCHPTVYVDGMRAPDGAVALDDYVWPEVIEGVEVYRSAAAAPARFAGQTTCGVIAIWTRPPGALAGDDRRADVSQRRGFLVSGLFGLIYALLR